MKINNISHDGVELYNGIKVTDYHDQECCECVFADWNALKDTTFENEIFNNVKIEKIKDSGFKINGYFVPCYNIQNGYYSSDLELRIIYPDGEIEYIDLLECYFFYID